jgi:hypothetical protein
MTKLPLEFSLTDNLSPQALPALAVTPGPIEVSGSLTVTFSVPVGWVRKWKATQREELLRAVRPYMRKRQFQRLRGMWRARDRRAGL